MRITFDFTDGETTRRVKVLLDVMPQVGQPVRFGGELYTVTEAGFSVRAMDPDRGNPAGASIIVVATT